MLYAVISKHEDPKRPFIKTKAVTTQTFQVLLADRPQTLSIDVIVSSGGDVQVNARSEESPGGRSVVLDVRSVGPESPAVASSPSTPPDRSLGTYPPHRYAVASSSSALASSIPPQMEDPVPQNHLRSSLTVEDEINEQAVPPPAYSRYEAADTARTPPAVPASRAPHVREPIVYTVHREPHDSDSSYPLIGAADHPNTPEPFPLPILPTIRELYEAMQRGEFVPQILADDSEPPGLPLNYSGRRRRYEEYSEDNEDEDEEEEERYARRTRSRASWGPLDFLRPGRS